MESAPTVKVISPTSITATLSIIGQNRGHKVAPNFVLNGRTCYLLVEFVMVLNLRQIGFPDLLKAALSSIPAKTTRLFTLSFDSMQNWDWPVCMELHLVDIPLRFYWD